MNLPRRVRLRHTRLAGFSLLESVISILLVGTLLVAAMRAVGSSVRSQRMMADIARATCLADSLMNEIHPQSYREPGTSESNIGREAGESNASRNGWDDVDDYHGLSESPPRARDGSPYSEFTGWKQAVTVRWVAPDNIASISGQETGVKRIIVEVSRDGILLATRVMLRAHGHSY